MSAEGLEMDCIETDIVEARSPFFNYEYIWKIDFLTKEVYIIIVFLLNIVIDTN